MLLEHNFHKSCLAGFSRSCLEMGMMALCGKHVVSTTRSPSPINYLSRQFRSVIFEDFQRRSHVITLHCQRVNFSENYEGKKGSCFLIVFMCFRHYTVGLKWVSWGHGSYNLYSTLKGQWKTSSKNLEMVK